MDTRAWQNKSIVERVIKMTESKVRYAAKVTPIDRLLAVTFLPLIPGFISPNSITVFRFLSIPFVLYFLITGMMVEGTVLFIISAFSDAIDGALARTKKKITPWGILFDPIADKLLVGSVAIILITKYISPVLTLAIVTIEIFLVGSAYFRYRGKLVPAKTVGKIKMILQCFGIIFLLFYALTGIFIWLAISTIILLLAVVFGLLSLFVYRSI